MMEEVLVGTDIMPAATHLTTSILSSAHPKTTFQDTKIATMEYGETIEQDEKGRVIRHIRIGALDLIEKEDAFDFMRADQEHQSGISSRIRKPVKAPNGSFDLVIMNPPFTKSTNHAAKRKDTKNPPFAAFDIPPSVQTEMAKKTRKLANSRKSLKVADMYAGLATHFMDIADTKVKRGGVVALVISAAFASGDSWKKMRNLLETRYEDIIVVSIAAAKSADKSFSSDTGMVEVLVVATRKAQDFGKRSSVSYFNFPRRPSSILEAVEFAKMISSAKTTKDGYSLRLGTSDRVGHCIKANSGFSNAIGPAGAICVSDLDVSRAAISLAQGRLSLPHLSDDDEFEVVRLKELGDVCCGHRSIENSGPFDLHDLQQDKNKPFPILWAHDVSPVEKGSIEHRESCMMVRPDRYGDLKTVEGKDGRKVHSPKHNREDMETLWNKNSTRLCFNSDFQLNSQCLGACIPVDAGGKICDVLGGQAWPGFRCKDKRHVIPLALWMNTTLGLFSFWCTGTRQQDGRSRISVRLLPLLAVPDMRDLTDEQIAMAKETFRVFSKKNMRPANEAWRDDVRQDLDRAVMIDVLGLHERILKPLDMLREKWCAEPSVHGGQATRPPGS